MLTLDKDRALGLAETAGDYASRMGLEWDISIGQEFDSLMHPGEDAYVFKRPDEQAAIIYINPEANERMQVRLLVHELLHVLLSDYEALALNSRSVDTMDALNAQQERVINKLATALTGWHWEPVDRVTRQQWESDWPAETTMDEYTHDHGTTVECGGDCPAWVEDEQEEETKRQVELYARPTLDETQEYMVEHQPDMDTGKSLKPDYVE